MAKQPLDSVTSVFFIFHLVSDSRCSTSRANFYKDAVLQVAVWQGLKIAKAPAVHRLIRAPTKGLIGEIVFFNFWEICFGQNLDFISK